MWHLPFQHMKAFFLLQRFLWIPEATLPLNKYSNGTGIIENVANFQYQGSAKSELY